MTAMLTPTRSLGKTGVMVPLLGFGTAPLGKPQVQREDAVRCLNEAIDRGVTYFDTSPDYGSEPVVGNTAGVAVRKAGAQRLLVRLWSA